MSKLEEKLNYLDSQDFKLKAEMSMTVYGDNLIAPIVAALRKALEQRDNHIVHSMHLGKRKDYLNKLDAEILQILEGE